MGNPARMKNLHFHLAQLDARQFAAIGGPSSSTLEFFRLGAHIIIVQIFADQQGYEVFIPYPDPTITGTFAGLSAMAHNEEMRLITVAQSAPAPTTLAGTPRLSDIEHEAAKRMLAGNTAFCEDCEKPLDNCECAENE